MKYIKSYIFFIKESQQYMKGQMHPVKIFLLSIPKGFWFCNQMRLARKGAK